MRVWLPDRPGALGPGGEPHRRACAATSSASRSSSGAPAGPSTNWSSPCPKTACVDLLGRRDQPGRRRRRRGRAHPVAPTADDPGLTVLATAARLVGGAEPTRRAARRAVRARWSEPSSATGPVALDARATPWPRGSHGRRARRRRGWRRSSQGSHATSAPTACEQAGPDDVAWADPRPRAGWRWSSAAAAGRSAAGSGASWPRLARIADAGSRRCAPSACSRASRGPRSSAGASATAGPAARPLDGALPLRVGGVGERPIGVGLERRVELPLRGDVVERRPTRPRPGRPGRRRRAPSSPGCGGRLHGARRADRPAAAAAGPSPTRRRRRAASVTVAPAAAAMASTTSRVWYAIASTTARARWARVVPRRDADDRAAGVRVPPRAAEAGERRHHVRRRRCRRPTRPAAPISAAAAMMPRPSRSHWTAAPVTKMAPSRA